MLLKKIKNKIQDTVKDAMAFDDYVFNYRKDDDCDINVSEAINNYKMYQNDLKQRQQNLIKKWYEEIKEASSIGKKFILTDQFVTDNNDKNKILYLVGGGTSYDFPSDASLLYFQQHFEKRGFKVIRIEYPNNTCCLKIIWISSENKDNFNLRGVNCENI